MELHMLVLCEFVVFVCLISKGFQIKLLFSISNEINEFNLETENTTRILTNLGSDIYSIAYDYNSGYIYFPRLQSNDIRRLQYPSEQPYTSELVSSASEPIGVTVDSINGHVYWTEYTAKKIYRCNLNGTDKLLILTDVDALCAITLDYRNRWLYYSTTYTTNTRRIRRSRLNGTDIENVIDEEASALSIDFNDERLYWMNFATGDLKYSYLNDTYVRKVFSTNTTIKNIGIYVLDRDIYCVNDNQILKVTLSPVTSARVIYPGTKRIFGLFVYKEKRKYFYRY
ncbi:protein cueball-like [Mytilus galloprovincialis]|uniref:protein cueball-like n=1 Tax=Mytilus galloprovincialis TaxID=29158 RepID=UPI003F7BDA74